MGSPMNGTSHQTRKGQWWSGQTKRWAKNSNDRQSEGVERKEDSVVLWMKRQTFKGRGKKFL